MSDSQNIFNNKSVILASALAIGSLGALIINKLLGEQQQQQTQQQDQWQFDKKKVKVVQTKLCEPYYDLDKKKEQQLQLRTQFQIPAQFLPNNKLLNELRILYSEGCLIDYVPHLILDTGVNEIQNIVNPLIKLLKEENFVFDASYIVAVSAYSDLSKQDKAMRWLRAGPRYNLYFNPKEVKALIVTCGGLVPGINVVIRELVMTLHYNYGVEEIYAAKFGFKGIYDEEWIKLKPDEVKTIHHHGGTYIGTSRGGFDVKQIVNRIDSQGVNQVYIIGGDGTLQAVHEIYKEISRKQLNIGICAIPKSLDNDIPIIDQSFGYDTSIDEAQKAIETAWVESHSHQYGVGIVRLMGRSCGYIAMGASMASRCVHVCLVPEFEYDLYGDHGLLNYVYQRLKKRGNCIIVVAEGAGDAIRDFKVGDRGLDDSGNKLFNDVGQVLTKEIYQFCSKQGIKPCIKYIDPMYMIRAVPSNSFDTKMCSQISQNAVHGLMSGFTGFLNGHVHQKTCFIRIEEIISGKYCNKITPSNKEWQRLLSSTGQPSFLPENVQLVK